MDLEEIKSGLSLGGVAIKSPYGSFACGKVHLAS